MRSFKKRAVCAVLAACMLCGSAALLPKDPFVDNTSITASAETWKDFEYSVSTNYSGEKIITITKYSGSGKNVTVPEKIDGATVRYIKEDVFKGNTKIESVTINAPLYYLVQNAFKDCTALKSAVLCDEINFGYFSIFEGCTSLEKVKLPEKLVKLPSALFKNCSKLTDIEMSKDIESISYDTFNGSKWLADRQKENPLVVYNDILIDGTTYSKSEITIPSNIKKVCGHAFEGNESLVSVTVPETVESLGSNAFEKCKNLEKAVINSQNTSLHGIF